MSRNLRRARAGRAAALLAGAALASCAPQLSVEPQTLAGSFRGRTAEGEEVAIAFSEEEQAFRGEGTIGDQPVVLAGAVGWRGTASLTAGDGRDDLVELTLSADGESLVLERRGQSPLTLRRGAAPGPAAASGPFAGRYRAVRERAPLAEVTLAQSGELLAGVGIVTGDPVGVSGRAAGDEASGVVTFADGSQVRFTAERGADGGLTVRGFGEPIALRRRAP